MDLYVKFRTRPLGTSQAFLLLNRSVRKTCRAPRKAVRVTDCVHG